MCAAMRVATPWRPRRTDAKRLAVRGGAFSPLRLAGLALWLDASQLALSNGAAVTSWTDRSGNSKHASQSDPAKQPLFYQNIFNGKGAVWFDGVNDCLQTPAMDLTGTQAVTVIALATPSTTAANRIIYEHGSGAGQLGFYFYHTQDGAPHNYGFAAGMNGNVGYSYQWADADIRDAPAIAAGVLDKSKSTNEALCFCNGGRGGSGGNSDNTNAFGNLVGNVGARNNGASFPYKGYIAELILYKRALSDSERQRVEDYLRRKWLRSMILLPEHLADNAYSEARGAEYPAAFRSSPFARLKFTTTSTALTIEFYNDIYGTFSNWAEIGVYVDGVYTYSFNARANNTSASGGIALGAGTKTVEIVAGLQTKPSGVALGSFLKRLTWQNGEVWRVAPTAPGMIVYGDSITIGGNSNDPCKEGWTNIVRQAYSGGLAVEGWGYRKLKDDAVDAAARSAFVTHLARYNASPSIIWLAIGLNDYQLSAWSAADFGTAYAALLDALHSQFSGATIYAQTPILRNTEGANSYGSTLGDYRTAIANAQASRSAWCTLVDGTGAAFPQLPGDYDADGVHPNVAGHAKYANAVKAVLGL